MIKGRVTISDPQAVLDGYVMRQPAQEMIIITNHDGVDYVIWLERDLLQCSCPGFQKHGHCKHQDYVAEQLKDHLYAARKEPSLHTAYSDDARDAISVMIDEFVENAYSGRATEYPAMKKSYVNKIVHYMEEGDE